MRRLALLLALLLLPVAAFADSQERPNATANESGTDCDTTDFHTTTDDDPDSPGNDWCSGTINTSWTATINMTNPAEALDGGADAQQFAIFIRLGTGVGGKQATAVRMDAYDGTDCVDAHETGTYQAVPGGAGTIITENWTAAGISDKDDVCIHIKCRKGGTQVCDVDAVEWRAVAAGPTPTPGPSPTPSPTSTPSPTPGPTPTPGARRVFLIQ